VIQSNYPISIVLPARNECSGLRDLLPCLVARFPDAEIIVVDDGSTDDTVAVCQEHGARVVSHPYSMGNGAAIKTGARSARGRVIVFMDADGQHDAEDIPRLLQKLDEGYEMAVGARVARTHASPQRRFANAFYNRLASAMTGHRIEDLTSGFRAVRARHFHKFIYLLPNGFSYPTTSTMAFFRSGFPVAYVPIHTRQRYSAEASKIRWFKDGLRFLVIILKIGALFSPMRLFLPIGGFLFLMGICYYGYTYFTDGRFTNMSALLFLSSLFTFLIGILSEQVSSLHYKYEADDQRRTRRGKNEFGRKIQSVSSVGRPGKAARS
jgi:glycosyltransferase involved in cell wall biosynthesis